MQARFFPAAVVLCLWPLPAHTQPQAMIAVATVKQLHEAIIGPASDAVFQVGSRAPATEQEWQALRNSAAMLAEAGNLLMIGPRARDRGAWRRLSRGLADAGASALKAATAKDVEAVSRAGDQIIDVCENCHTPYRDGGRGMRR